MGPVDIDAIRRGHKALAAQIRVASTTAAFDAGQFAVDYAINKSNEFKRNSPSPTREATRYTVKTSRRGAVLRVFNNQKVAKFLEGGTKPHRILPRKKRFLKFQGSSGVVFSRGVNHPGTRATHWFANLANQTFEHMEAGIKRSLLRVAHNFKRMR